MKNLLDDEFNLDPNDYGWENIDGKLLPQKHLLHVPEDLLKTCSCKAADPKKRCNTQRCSCKKAQVTCSCFCECKYNCKKKAA